jgi:hypothetical protein
MERMVELKPEGSEKFLGAALAERGFATFRLSAGERLPVILQIGEKGCSPSTEISKRQ